MSGLTRLRALWRRHGHARGNATLLVVGQEPQHPRERLRAFTEHGQKWVECMHCGRQWSVRNNTLEQVSEGDGYCDENPAEE